MNEFERFYRGKKVLVTGGAGFIGSHIAEILVQLGSQVTVMDNFSAGSLNNLRSVVTNINLMYADITSPYSCQKATTDKDIVFHLAAFVSVPFSIKNPTTCFAVNVQGTKNLLDASTQNHVASFVLSSSAAIYGNKETPCSENDQPNPLSPYAQTKLEAVHLCKKYAQEQNLNTVCLRYFNVYGERQNPYGDYASVIPKFKNCLITKKPITIFGDGTQTRDFIHVSKVVEANLKTAMLPNSHGEIFNIASGKSMNLLDLIKKLEQEVAQPLTDITYKPSRHGDIMKSQANCSKYEKITTSC